MKEKALYKYALDQAAIVGITDQHGTITYANDLFCSISKYSRSELIGANHRILNSNYHNVAFFKEMWQTIAAGKVWRNEIRNKAKDGSFYWVDTTIVPFLDDDGKPYQYLSIRTDISARKKAEDDLRKLNEELEIRVADRTRELYELNEALEQKVKERTEELIQANRELETFNYSVSHDLQAPLRILSGFCDLLQEEHGNKLDKDAQRYVAIIRENSVRMGKLIKALLNFAQLGKAAVYPTKVEMDKLARVCWEEVTHAFPGIKLQLILHPLDTAYGDSGLLHQVWCNLISNAVKYSSRSEAPVVEVGMAPSKYGLAYFVRDNGVGFDMRYADNLFKVFRRLDNADQFEGTGIGLANVHRIIMRHGGKVWAESKLGEGATFYFFLPEANTPTAPNGSHEKQSNGAG